MAAENGQAANQGPDELDQLVMLGGAGGLHPPVVSLHVLAAPSIDSSFNAVRPPLAPIACVLLKDSRFDFDSSFIGPRVFVQMKYLARLRERRPGLVASIFGHADPVGDDAYNKELSGRRARAVYALLTRKIDLWEDLYSNPKGGDKWGDQAIRTMLRAVGHGSDQSSEQESEDDESGGGSSAPPPKKSDDDFKAAVKEFQSDNGLSPDGIAGPATRKKLFKAYMDAICIDGSGQSFQLDNKKDFLAQGADADGKGDYQGCGEFNPVLLFSKAQKAAFDEAKDKSERNDANRANRRVMIFLFREGLKIAPDKWPCPKAKDGIAGCKKRFFSDGDRRRANRDDPREYRMAKDTFACRFYDRLAHDSPCETGPETALRCHLAVLLRSNSGCVALAKRKYKVTITPDRVLEGTTDEHGLVLHPDIPPGEYKLEIDGRTTFVPATPAFREPREHQVVDYLLFQEDEPEAPPPSSPDDHQPPEEPPRGKPLPQEPDEFIA